MSVFKRGQIYWYDFTVDQQRYRGSTKQRGKAAALKYEGRKRSEAALGAPSRAVLTLEQASSLWFIARVAGRKSETTTGQRLEVTLRLLGADTLINAIDAPEIAEAIQKRRLEPTRQSRAGNVRLPANATVNRDLIDTTLRPIFRYARKVLKQPVADVEWCELRLAEPQGRTRTFTPNEMEAHADELPVWHRPLRDFLARYGLRLREAFFHPDAVNTATWRITISERKGGIPHTIPIALVDRADIAARLGRAKAAELETIWFREMKNGALRAIKPRGFQSASRRALDLAGVADARPAHDFRHHAATAALRAPRSTLKTVQQLLGHRSIASTARYAHAEDQDVLDAVNHVAAPARTPRKRNVT